MKSILVTYNVTKWNGQTWEDGEAAARFDFLDDYIVGELQATFSAGKDRKYKATSWHTFIGLLSKLEELRGRTFINGSIKKIEIVDKDC